MQHFTIYSPVEEIYDELFARKSIRLFIKRDDCIHPFISGNKWRKLKHLLQKAENQQKNHLVTFGGAWSNHLLATACAGATFKFKTTAFVRGETVTNPVLDLCRLFGMELRFTSRESYRDKPSLFQTYFADNTSAFFIDEGGASAEAVQGCAEIIDELQQPFSHLFCAAGTGTTAAGLSNGLTARQANTQLHIVPVLKGAGFLKSAMNSYINRPDNFLFHENYHFGGYAKTTPELMDFIRRFTSQTGILIDPIYTGKMLYAIYDLAQKDYFKPGETILALHTGGIFGLLGKLDKAV
ncbi:pyridoxal-phosphate dependent enzyme [Pedobacter sp. BS3]|uniref:1-aminocyclopropane-1-carboxylate deaminase/D-cysteine desulfhydrase n=1 Tax=Pedobacter sp. BS3 TaxID=2567937 RepID=UPI0011F06C4F|nr:pyridoxal-phosphate dependent enzyme [Pedobacter sp. BS3]TZF84818.1 pyridoxal-phosphate dependent enzyme [Pedobacter sp. BS3]